MKFTVRSTGSALCSAGADTVNEVIGDKGDRAMKNRPLRRYHSIRSEDGDVLDEKALERLLDARERPEPPLRTANTRKSIEHHLERQRLKRSIADYDWGDDWGR